MTLTRLPRLLFTSPWRGEVGSRGEPGGGELHFEEITPPRTACGGPTLPLQGRVKNSGALA